MAAARAEKWNLITIIQTKRGSGYLIGSIGGQDVVFKQTITNKVSNIFVSNLENKETTREVSRNTGPVIILYRCVTLNRNENGSQLVAWGTRDSRILITRNFEQFKDKTFQEIPLDVPSHSSILLTIDEGDTLMAAAYGSSVIHLININDWSITEKRTVDKAVKIHGMHAMANGHIAVRTKYSPEDKDICILDASGAIIKTMHLHDRDVYDIAVNKRNDSILVLYRDRQNDDFAVDIFSSSGKLSTQRILSFRKAAVTYLSFSWLSSNQIAIHVDAEGDIYVYSPEGLDLP